jgi:hypothetical protein
MNRTIVACAIAVALVVNLPAGAGAEQAMSPHFEPLRPFIGKTWKGEMGASTPEKPIFDVSRWELALGGKAVRILHSINDGQYGGETVIVWDPEKKSLVSFYFTTAGFYAQGKINIRDGKFTTHEKVTGAKGITEVRAISEMLPDGRLKSTAWYLKDGDWVKGHEVLYKEAPDAKVILD